MNNEKWCLSFQIDEEVTPDEIDKIFSQNSYLGTRLESAREKILAKLMEHQEEVLEEDIFNNYSIKHIKNPYGLMHATDIAVCRLI